MALIGASRLSDPVMRARLMEPDEMMARGMVAAVTPDDASLVDRAQALAEEVAANAPLPLWATKIALLRLRERMAPEGADRDLICAATSRETFARLSTLSWKSASRYGR